MIQWDIVYLDPKDPEYSVNQMTFWWNFIKFHISKINVLCKSHASDGSFEDMENSEL